jgi:hypothetical protein
MASGNPIYQILDYAQGDEGAEMDFIAQWRDSPPNSFVSFHAMVDPEGGPVTIPLTSIRTASGAIGVRQRVQAGYVTQIVLVFFPGAPVPPGFDVSIRVQYATGID